MSIDWMIVSQIGAPVIAVFVGAAVTRYFSQRERLMVYYGHISSHILKSLVDGREDTQINTHTVIVRNEGNKTATNVRIVNHAQIPDIRVYPTTQYEINTLPEKGQEIVIPRIGPKMEYTISYLYLPPVTYNLIQTYVASDSGPAKTVNVRLQQVFPKWVNVLFAGSMVLGLIAFIYILFEVVRYVVSIWP